MLFMCVRLFMLFIRESLFRDCTKEKLFLFFKFTCTLYKIKKKLVYIIFTLIVLILHYIFPV